MPEESQCQRSAPPNVIHQDVPEEESEFPLFRIVIIQELREEKVRRDRDVAELCCKAAVVSCGFHVLLHVAGVGAADIDERTVTFLFLFPEHPHHSGFIESDRSSLQSFCRCLYMSCLFLQFLDFDFDAGRFI